MTNRFLTCLLSVATALAAPAATSPIYINFAPLHSPPQIAPQIDATAFLNESIFEVNNYYSLYPTPFQMLNTRFVTNTGSMYGQPGFRFDFFNGNVRRKLDWWVNQGDISTYNSNQFYFSIYLTPANWLLISATNLVHGGTLSADAQSLVHLEGENLNLAGGRIRTGQAFETANFITGTYLRSSNYWNDVGIEDIYYALGTNNMLDSTGVPMQLDGRFSFTDPDFTLPFASSPEHQVIEDISGYRLTNYMSLPAFGGAFGGAFNATAFTRQVGATSFVVQVAFISSNLFNSALVPEVRFAPEADGGATIAVGLQAVENDIVFNRRLTNTLYLLDALAFETNVFLAQNGRNPSQRRPATYSLTKSAPFQYRSGLPGNTVYTPQLLYNPATHLSNAVTVLYAAYGAQVNGSSTLTASSGVNPELLDPTNNPGRIEIFGKQVDLTDARIRAESTLVIKAENLTGQNSGRIEAPIINYDVGTTQPVMLISNLAPSSIKRLSGYIFAWSATWVNTEVVGPATNEVRFHVLMLDHNFATDQPVSINRFAARATNHLVIRDQLNVAQAFKVDAQSLYVAGGLFLPTNYNWAATNVLNVRNFTNDGVVSVPGSASLGTDRAAAYATYINRGTNYAGSHFVRARELRVEGGGQVFADGGVLAFTGEQIKLTGPPAGYRQVLQTNYTIDDSFMLVTNITTNLVLTGTSLIANEVRLNGGSLLASNVNIQAGVSLPSSINFAITNVLVDGGPGSTNFWYTTAGVKGLVRPQSGDLRNTHIKTTAGVSRRTVHIWPGANAGGTSAAFENNLAIGKLTLDGEEESSFSFAGTTKNCALYVEYLELLNNATNFTSSIQIDPDFKVYFAHANFPASKLDGALGGRLVWVRGYTGPLSSTNLVYPSGKIYTANLSVVLDKDLDSDGDGEVNSKDPTPIYVPETVDLKVAITNDPARVVLSWHALANSSSVIEFKDSAVAPGWQGLLATNSPVDGRMSVVEPIDTKKPQRIYRITVYHPSF